MSRDTSIEHRALRAYVRRAALQGGLVIQPSGNPDVDVDAAGRRHVVLANMHGVLGVYAHDEAKDRLQWVEPAVWEAGERARVALPVTP